MSAIDALSKKHIVLTSTSGWADKNDNLSIEQYRGVEGCNSVLAVCMTAAYETFHHWEIFAGGQTGLYIQLNREKFSKAVESDPRLLAGPVTYLGLKEIRALEKIKRNEVPFLKRSGFKDEMEYRVIVKNNDPKCLAYPIKINADMIEKIVFSPFIPAALVTSTKEVMKSIEGCSGIDIGQSQLTTNKEWIKHIDRLL
jgi:hypothetical protein